MSQRIAAGRLAVLAAIICLAAACDSALTGPDSTSAPPDAIVVEVLAMNGDRSFSPNPLTVPEGATVVWHNADISTHHIVFDAGGLDAGEVRPGRFTAPMVVTAVGGYHCSIHPSMVGTVRRRQ
jgi:plastocyanin